MIVHKFLSILSIFCFLTIGCHKKTVPSVTPSTPTQGFTYLALGDSYTIGQSVAEKERYPNQLVDSLKVKNIQIGYIKNIARTGWTTDELKNNIPNYDIKDSTFDIVSLLIGVNNQYRGRSVEPYKMEFKDLLDEAIKRAKGRKDRVFVVSIPDYAYTRFGGGDANISKGIDEYNAANKKIANTEGVVYIDITPISRNGLKDPTLVASDGLHPSGKQYSLWVNLMLPEIVKLLK